MPAQSFTGKYESSDEFSHAAACRSDMTPSPWLLPLCREHLQNDLPAPLPSTLSFDELIRRIAHLVARNLDTGRAVRVAHTEGSDPTDVTSWLPQYIRRVAIHYLREQPRLAALEAGDPNAWTALHKTLTAQAYHQLRRAHGHGYAQQQAPDIAQDVCETIYRAPYPCDVPFDAWAARILVNQVYAPSRSGDVLDISPSHIAGLDALLERTGAPVDSAGEDPLATIDVQLRLLSAIEQLPSQAQQVVIVQGYLLERDVEEIADFLGRTPQAVYNLRYRALRKLKVLLLSEK